MFNSKDCLRRAVVVAIFAMLGGAAALAAQTDVIRGRVTNSDGQALQAVRVTATSLPGNVTRSAITNAEGRFQIAFPGGPGDYIMGYSLFGYNFRQYEVKRLADEDVLVADARLAPIQLDSLVVVAQQQQRVNRNSQTPDVSGTERPVINSLLPPELMGDIAAMAASLPGVLLIPGLDGDPDGFSVLGLGADQNSVTLNGMNAGTGNLPRDAAISSSLTTSPFDVSRGGFSGANFNITSRGGSNFRSRGMSLVMTTPQVQWTDRAAQALGNDYTNFSLGGMASGPIKLNKSFYNVSYQLGRNSRDNNTLLSTSPLGLQTAGVAMDSVSHFLDILHGNSVPTFSGSPHANRVSDQGSVFGSLDFSPPGSANGHSFNVTFNGNFNRQAPVGGGATTLESSGGDRISWGGGLQARHSGYLGLVLSETSLGFNLNSNYGDPYLVLPAGRVRVNSVFEDGSNGVQSLVFGGNQGLSSSAHSTTGSLRNTLSWFDNANKHRLKLTTEAQFSGNTQDMSQNLLGSFYYNSLADLEAGIPASFTRTLTARERSTGLLNGSISLGDSWRKSQDLQFQYGIRADLNHYTTMPAYNALVESTFGKRNDHVPTPISLSPRIGFSWTVGRANEIAAFTGAARAPRAVIRGGIGMFTNSAGTGQIGNVLDNTGLPSGTQQINCVGPAVPQPNWASWSADPSTIPDRCADGTSGSVFSNPAPSVTLFADDYTPQRTIRSNLSWSGTILDARFALNAEGTYSLNRNQGRSLDLNFNPMTRFTLSDEGRPVYVAPTSIVPTTGTIASRDARVSQSFARVSELRSDLESRTAQLQLRLSPIYRTPTKFNWSAAYTYSHIREQVSGFSSTVGNPLDVEWARSGQGPHQFTYNLRYRLFNAVDISWNGSFRSGGGFTPMIAGDVNGDGYSNDRAFIYAPNGAADPAVAAGMRALLETATGATRDCLEKQLGELARRNSCRGPWTSSASLTATLDRAKFRIPQRGAITFSLSNPLGAADLLVHGSNNLKGWGQSISPDQSLLYVRGFDAQTQRYTYEVNQRFGATRPQFMTLRAPVTLTATMRIDLGPTRERQGLIQQLSSGRSQPGMKFPEAMYRTMGSNQIMNPMATILRSQDSLHLTAMQADSVAAMNRRYTYRADSLWTPVARYFAQLPKQYSDDEAYDRYIHARHEQVDMLSDMVSAVRKLITPEQRRKLPASVINMLDARYLALIRNGTAMYVGTGGIGPIGVPEMWIMAGSGGDMHMVEMAVKR